MTIDLNDLLSVLLAIFGLVGLAAGAAAYFRTNYIKSSISLLTQNNAAQEARIQILERSEADKIAKITSLETQVATFQDENRRLTTLLQGRADLSILGERLSTLEAAISRHHEEVMEDRREFFRAWETSLAQQEEFFGRMVDQHGGGERSSSA